MGGKACVTVKKVGAAAPYPPYKTRPFNRRAGKRERARRHVSLSVLSEKGLGKGSL